jgi:hypothetical protein
MLLSSWNGVHIAGYTPVNVVCVILAVCRECLCDCAGGLERDPKQDASLQRVSTARLRLV